MPLVEVVFCKFSIFYDGSYLPERKEEAPLESVRMHQKCSRKMYSPATGSSLLRTAQPEILSVCLNSAFLLLGSVLWFQFKCG